MNNDLEQFSEERLIELSRFKQASELAALARIALSVKQAKPVRFMAEWSSPHGGMECDYSEVRSEMDEVAAEHDGSVIDFYTTPQPAHTEQVIPEGWKLVPIQPTEEMINAWGEDMGQSYASVHAEQIGEDELVFAYQAMIAAAPKPESE